MANPEKFENSASLIPPIEKNADGETRKAGFEIEYTGVTLEDSVKILIDIFGGEHVAESRFDNRIVGTRYGDFTVMIDTAVLQNQAYDKYLKKVGVDLDFLRVRNTAEEIIDNVASIMVPYEVVTPPIPMTALHELDRMSEALRESGAKGTGESIFYAFGLHINAEMPSSDSAMLLNYLRAFSLLYLMIVEESKVDISRSISPYIDKFPKTYINKILAQDYSPTIEELADDYMEENPTRNRPLDMLPLLFHILGDPIKEKAKEPHLLSSRPAFHYRLPNCRIDEADWHISDEWLSWLKVETLASDPGLIEKMTESYYKTLQAPFGEMKWVIEARKWMNQSQ